jgi:anti-sigma B factor antagonist
VGLRTVLSGWFLPVGRAPETHCGTASERVGKSYDFELSGSLDHKSAPRIRKLIFEKALRHREVRIDLSGLEFIDSAGLATLVEAFAAAKSGDVDMAFHRPSESVRRVLRFTRLDQVFRISDSVILSSTHALAPVHRRGRFTRRSVSGRGDPEQVPDSESGQAIALPAES